MYNARTATPDALAPKTAPARGIYYFDQTDVTPAQAARILPRIKLLLAGLGVDVQDGIPGHGQCVSGDVDDVTMAEIFNAVRPIFYAECNVY